MSITLSLTNVLLPQGQTQDIYASGYVGTLTWEVAGNAGVTLGTPSGDGVPVSIASNATVASSAILKVTDGASNYAETIIMVGPASAYTSRDLLVYGNDGSSTPTAYLLNADDGTFTRLPAIPGVLTSTVLDNANPTTQVVRPAGMVHIACYVLNMNKLTSWSVG